MGTIAFAKKLIGLLRNIFGIYKSGTTLVIEPPDSGAVSIPGTATFGDLGATNVLVNTATKGTSAVGVVAIKNGTAPGSQPADETQIYSADISAGNAAAHIVSEGLVAAVTLGSLTVRQKGGVAGTDEVQISHDGGFVVFSDRNNSNPGRFELAGTTYGALLSFNGQTNGGALRGNGSLVEAVTASASGYTGFQALYVLVGGSMDASIYRVGAGAIGFGTTGATGAGYIGNYKGVATAGWGVPAVYGTGRVVGTVDARAAAAATYTVGAADGSFEVSGNVLVTASTTHSFSLDVSYTDESNTARTLILPMALLTGSLLSGGLITNVSGAVPYHSVVVQIRAKAATAITVRVSAGTFTSVTYNSEGLIKQVA